MEGSNVAYSYNKLWKLMIDKNINKTYLHRIAGITSNDMTNIENNKPVNTEILAKICHVLECAIDDIVEIFPDKHTNSKEKNIWKYFFFDFNFTIADTKDDIVSAFNATFRNMGLKTCSEIDIIKTIGLSLKDAYITLQADFSEKNIAYFCKEIQKKTTQLGKNSYVYNGVKELFQWLNFNHCKIGIVTSNDIEVVKELLEKNGCFSYVDIVIDGNRFPFAKPNPAPILKAMELLGANQYESVFIGDCLIDAQAATNANIDFVAVLTGWENKKSFVEYGISKNFIFDDIQCFFKKISTN